MALQNHSSRVLWVDDDYLWMEALFDLESNFTTQMINAIRKLLSCHNCSLDVVDSFSKAYLSASSKMYDLIFLDDVLPADDLTEELCFLDFGHLPGSEFQVFQHEYEIYRTKGFRHQEFE